jgi:hypothetical protein
LSPTSGIVECNGRPKPVGNIADHHHHKSILQPMDYELGFLKN